MRVQELAVINQQIQLVLRRAAVDDTVKYLKTFLRIQRSSEFCRCFVDTLKDIQEYSLAVRLSLLQKDILVQPVVLKNGTVVDQRPTPAAVVRSDKGMAILIFHVADRRQTDMRQRGFCNDRFRQQFMKILALIRTICFAYNLRILPP